MHEVLRGGAWHYHDTFDDPCGNPERTQCMFAVLDALNTYDRLEDELASVRNTVYDAEVRQLAPPAAVVSMSVSKNVVIQYDKVAVTYQMHAGAPTSKDWIGVFCVDDEKVELPDSEYIDWKWTGGKASGTLEFGQLVNMRCSWQFRFFTQVHENPATYLRAGKSNWVQFEKGHSEPLHVRIAMTTDSSEMRVMWVSSAVKEPTVWYGRSPSMLSRTARATATTYGAGDMCHAPATTTAAQYFRDPGMIYTAVMAGLEPEQTYYYKVGDPTSEISPVFMMKTPPAPGAQPKSSPMSFFMYGDLGDWNIKATGPKPEDRTATTIELMRDEMDDPKSNYVAIMHDGDISYAMGRTYLWDQFGALVQPVATEIPYMVGIGNHEYCHTSGGEGKDPSGAPGNGFHPSEGNYGDESQGECGVPFNKRFIMPANGNKVFWWSVEYGLTHHTQISSEHDYTPGSPMYTWLVNDLKSVDRKKTPWLFLHLHRPMYCSEDYAGDYKVSLLIRKHIEPLLAEYKVDAVFAGHYHAFERTCPVYREKCLSEKLPGGLEKAKAPVHIMVGSGGADIDNAGYYNVTWQRAAQMEYGYGRLHVHNATHTQFEFMRNKDRKIVDTAWIISDHEWVV
uniref:Purple acid phosphatase n=1 Tax=Globisporangium ultimum (strain ATCC 200006 / CBS 805.95 / DAOM BR144) TaxID=431595 RepID=K3WC58_GLOUD